MRAIPCRWFQAAAFFAWHDGRENPDTFQALITYPKGFLVSYSTGFSSHVPSFTRIMGKNASMTNIGGEGSPRWRWIEDRPDQRGDKERDLEEKRLYHDVLLPGEQNLPIPWMGDEDLSHLTNWLDSIRTRKQPNATVQHGFSHSVVGIMAAQSYWLGKRLHWDARSESIVDHITT